MNERAGQAGPGVPGSTVLAIDTATSRVVVAIGTIDGMLVAESTWSAGHRHGETLLPAIAGLLEEHELGRSALTAIVVGTGPGTFTGLRVGLATAKGLAHGLRIPIVGISTASALLYAAAGPGDGAADLALLVPAGPQDRVLVDRGRATRLGPSVGPELAQTTTLVAVDLEGGRAPEEAVARGDRALEGLGAALLRLGTERLRSGETDNLDRLVPEYVTLPRGVTRESGEVAWSRDRR